MIDTLLSEEIYFQESVAFHNLFSSDLVIDQSGTVVTSLIVAGPQLNPLLET